MLHGQCRYRVDSSYFSPCRLDFFVIPGDSSSSGDESYLGSTSRNGPSNFTVSTHSAFQPNVPKLARTSQNQEAPASSSRLNDEEMDRNDNLSDHANNESNESNVETNRTLRIIQQCNRTQR